MIIPLRSMLTSQVKLETALLYTITKRMHTLLEDALNSIITWFQAT